jgi:plasmid replication initiation protein
MDNQKKKKISKIAVQSNALINARYDMTAFQKKILLYIIAKIQPDDKDFQNYVINIKDFVEEADYKSKMLYEKLRKDTKALISKVYEIEEPDGLLQVSILAKAKYIKNKGQIHVSFAPDLKPYLLQLKEQFTATPLRYVLNFKSVHSMRIYEMLQQFKSTGFLITPIEDLKYRLSLEDKYKTYTLFKRRVVEQAQKELQHTDMAFEFTEVKKGRKVVKLQFRIKPANEILLSEEQERASKKLETDLFLSPLQAKKIVIYVPNKEVLKTIFDIKTAQREGRIKTNIAAYAYGVFKIKYQLDLQKKLSN